MQQFKLGKITFLCGDIDHVKYSLFKTLIDAQKNGGVEKILFVDTLNCLNVHEIAPFEPQQEKYYKNIYCVRTERPYDLWARLGTCENFIKLRKIEALFIPSLNHFLRDGDEEEIRPLLYHIMSKIKYLTKKYNLLTLIGNNSNKDENIISVPSYLMGQNKNYVSLAIV